MKIKHPVFSLLVAIIALFAGGFAISSLVSCNGSQDNSPIETSAFVTSAQPTTLAAEIITSAAESSSTDYLKATTKAATQAEVGSEGAYEYAYAGFDPVYASVNSAQWNLLLVNRDYMLPEDYSVKLAPSITADEDSKQLDYRVAPYYNDMYLAAKADGVILTPVSGYRSVERQKNNFENKINYYLGQGYSKAEATQLAAKIILPPGTSEHNAGLAMDICSLDVDFEDTAEFRWLSENAADYGFILRYPENKQDTTKITYEPWHWRYVGVQAAQAMKASGQCFEEYLGMD